jgi:predicted ArsR family transcriptional regulator
MTDKLPTLDPLLHQPARTQIVAYLSGLGEASFSDLKRALDVTDGNLGAHMGKLVEAGLVEAGEGSGGGRAQTLFRLTKSGRSALEQYVARLAELMKIGTPQRAPSARPIPHRPKPRST